MINPAFYSRSVKLVLIGLLLVVASFFAGTFFGRGSSPARADSPDPNQETLSAEYPGERMDYSHFSKSLINILDVARCFVEEI